MNEKTLGIAGLPDSTAVVITKDMADKLGLKSRSTTCGEIRKVIKATKTKTKTKKVTDPSESK